MKGYKVFNKYWTCRNFKYEVGETYKHDGKLELCGSGFHFCEKVADCFKYYDFNTENKIAEIEAVGEVRAGNDKSVTDEIKIIREVTWQEMLTLANTGKGNTGLNNSGDRNSGDGNSGNRNSGDENSGDENSGYWNSGDENSGNSNNGNRNSGYWNSGNRNSGNRNSGNRNSGYRNSGNRNSGDYNQGDHCTGDFNLNDNESGCFCTEQKTIRFFDKESNLTYDEWKRSDACRLLMRINNSPVTWILSRDMSEEEKEQHPDHETTGGYLRKNDVTKAYLDWWESLTEDEKEIIKAIPNFDASKFKMITGIEV